MEAESNCDLQDVVRDTRCLHLMLRTNDEAEQARAREARQEPDSERSDAVGRSDADVSLQAGAPSCFQLFFQLV
jgi:hypothetical protein